MHHAARHPFLGDGIFENQASLRGKIFAGDDHGPEGIHAERANFESGLLAVADYVDVGADAQQDALAAAALFAIIISRARRRGAPRILRRRRICLGASAVRGVDSFVRRCLPLVVFAAIGVLPSYRAWAEFHCAYTHFYY